MRNSGENRRSRLACNLRLHEVDRHLPGAEPHRRAQLAEVLRAYVGRHNDDGIGEISAFAAAVGQPSFIERLEKDVEEARTRLLDLVEQHD